MHDPGKLETVLRYHEQTKHHFNRYARALGHLEVFGLKDLAFQSLYHFMVGGAVEDPRLTTLAPYGAHVAGQQRGMDLP
jgi:hypothetical protein